MEIHPNVFETKRKGEKIEGYEEIPLDVFKNIYDFIPYEAMVMQGGYTVKELSAKLFRQYGTYSFIEYVFRRCEAKDTFMLPKQSLKKVVDGFPIYEKVLDKIIDDIPLYYISKYLYLLPGYEQKYNKYFMVFINQNPTIDIKNIKNEKSKGAYYRLNPNITSFNNIYINDISQNIHLSIEYIAEHKDKLNWKLISKHYPIDEKFYNRFEKYLIPGEFEVNIIWNMSFLSKVDKNVDFEFVCQTFPLSDKFFEKYDILQWKHLIALNPTLNLKWFKKLDIDIQDYFQGEAQRDIEIIKYLKPEMKRTEWLILI